MDRVEGSGGGRSSLLTPLRAVAANPGLRRVVGAYVGFNIAEWATWIAILVFAFEQGGAAEAGLVALIQLAPAAVVAPLAATLGDRFPRERVLLSGYLVQAVAMAATAIAIAAGAPKPVVYAAAALTATTMTLTRPTHGSILPSLARTPAELTAANVASGTVVSACLFIAPAFAGLLLQSAGAAAVFTVTAVGCAASAALVATVRIDRAGAAPNPGGPVLHELVGGFRAIASLPAPRTVIGLIGAEAMIEGATDIFIVVLALEILFIGEAGAGYLNSAVGAGGLVGAAVAVSLVGRTRLAVPFAAGLVLAGLPLVIAGLVPGTIVALGAMVALGAGRSVMDVAGRTLLQRVTPDVSLARVFGVLEGMHMAMLAVGSVAVPILIGLAGARQGLIAAAVWLPAVVLVTWRALRRVDSVAVIHVRELQLLRGLPMFAPLAQPVIERLSAQLVPVVVDAGDWIIRQGEAGDRFYVIDRGEVEVLVDQAMVRVEGPGEGFGEIALLRDVPRTASVRARGDVALYALERGDFLAAIAGHPAGRRAADTVAAERLASLDG